MRNQLLLFALRGRGRPRAGASGLLPVGALFAVVVSHVCLVAVLELLLAAVGRWGLRATLSALCACVKRAWLCAYGVKQAPLRLVSSIMDAVLKLAGGLQEAR